MNESKDGQPIQIQGRIYLESRTYALCKAAPSKKVFRTLLKLAEEASTVREAVASSSASHPLEGKLSSMSSAQVVIYLMGLTEKLIQGQGQNQLSDKVLNTPTGAKVVLEPAPKRSGATSDEKMLNGEPEREIGALVMDGELLESFTSFQTQFE